MSTGVSEHEARRQPNAAEASVALLDNEWAQQFSEAMAYGYGYQVDIVLSDEISTSVTSLSLKDQKIQVQISRQLIERAGAEDQLDFLGFNILHELGHVKRFVAQPPAVSVEPKYAYFNNIVDDVAINFDAARKTRFVSDLTTKAYDQYLFPIDKRGAIATQPRHQQFMETLLLLSMTTDIYRKPRSETDLAKALTNINCADLDETVVEKLADVINHASGKRKHNLLGQIREYGEDLPYYRRVIAPIRMMYDELYEADKDDQEQARSSETGDAEPESGNSEFDYGDSAGCQHTEQTHDQNDSSEQGDGEKGSSKGTDSPQVSDHAKQITKIGKQIGEQMAKAISEHESTSPSEQKAQQLTAEQLERLRKELGLEEADFQGFLNTVNKYQGEIYAVTDLILQLRRERQDNFLAPSHEVSSHGRRLHIRKLLGYLASGSLDTTPDIWKTPAIQERSEYEFDGADFYFLCDASDSMAGSKAVAASESAVVLSQGIQDTSLEAYDDVPPIQIQVQAFGSDQQTLCGLTDAPKNIDLGRMYTALRNPNSSSTQVSGALAKITPAENRLSVVLVLSDGEFHDREQAVVQGKRLEEAGAIIVQCVFGGADVSKLSANAKNMNIQGAQDLPGYLFGIMPELINTLRTTHHA